MWGIVVAGLFFIGMGVFMLIAPSTVQEWEQTRNSYQGYQSQHGDRYRSGLKIRGVVVLAVGVVIITMPLWVRVIVGG